MPSQAVTEGLLKLQSKLLELEPAIEHTRIAQEATELVRTIGDSHHKLLTETGKKLDGHLTQSQVICERAYEKLKGVPALMQDTLLSNLDTVQEKLDSARKELERNLSGITKSFQENLTSISNIHADKVDHLNKSIDLRTGELNAASQNIVAQISSIQGTADQLKAFVRQLADINLPLRLDKLDATVAAINIGIQNQQTSVTKLEEKITNTLSGLTADFAQSQQKLSEELLVSAQKSKSRHSTSIILGVLGFIAVILVTWWLNKP